MCEDLAWLAGFVDGEGYFGCSLKSNGNAVQLAISQSGSPELLEKCRRILGFGFVNGPYAVVGKQPIYRFGVSGIDKVRQTATVLWPYLGTKKKQQIITLFNRIGVEFNG